MMTGEQGPLNNRQKEYIEDIYESGIDLLDFINDILDLSKAEADKMELELSKFNLRDVIDKSLIIFREQAVKNKIKIETEQEERIEDITADERKIKQVLFNLLSNAIKFTTGGGSVSVQVRRVKCDTELDDFDYVIISVTDTGIGISVQNQKKLFQPFQQLDTALTKNHKGTGLGLSLCRRLVELHGGRIWVESELEKGSKFIFTIPLKALPYTEDKIDSVTKLPTITYLLGDIERILSFHNRKGQSFGLLKLEIDRLPKPEDNIFIAEALKKVVRKHEIIAHCKNLGCYFVILLDIDIMTLGNTAERIKKVIEENNYSGRIKTAIYPQDGENVEKLLMVLNKKK